MIRLGCCAYNFRGWDLETSVRFTRQLGFTHVNLGAFNPSFPINPLDMAESPEKTGRMIAAIAQRHEVSLIELFLCSVHIDRKTRIDPNHPKKELRERMLEQFKKTCHCAAIAGLHHIMGVPGQPQENTDPSSDWELSVETLARMVRIAADNGVGFSVEPHAGSIIDQPNAAMKLAESVPGLAYSLDYAHFEGQGIPMEQVLPLHEYAVHIHAKPARPGSFKCLFHEGKIDFNTIIHDLTRRSWEGVIAMECMYPVDAATLTEHPASQSLLLATRMEEILKKEASK